MQPLSRAPLVMIFVTVFIDLLGFGIVLPLLPRYAAHFDLRGPGLGLLMASFSAMQFLFAPIWGRVSDRVGRRPVLMLGLLGSTLCYALFGVATSLGPGGRMLGLGVVPWLFIGRIGAGIAGATIPTAQAYIADVTTAANRAKGMALIGAAFGMGFTFGPLLGSLFVSGDLADPALFTRPGTVQKLSLTPEQSARIEALARRTESALKEQRTTLSRQERNALVTRRDTEIAAVLGPKQRAVLKAMSAPSPWPGYVAAVLSGVAFLSSVFLLPESLQPGVAHVAEGHWLSPGVLVAALGQPAVGLILFAMFLTTFAFAQFESTLSLLTAYLGLADRHNYFVYAYIGVLLTLSQGLLVRRLVPVWGERVMSVLGTVLMMVGLIAIGIAGHWDSVGLLYVVLPITVLGFSALTPSLASLLSRQSADSQQGGVLGLGQSMASLARILGPIVGLTLNDLHTLWPYWFAGGVMALGIVLQLAVVRAVRMEAEPRSVV